MFTAALGPATVDAVCDIDVRRHSFPATVRAVRALTWAHLVGRMLSAAGGSN